MAFCNYIVPQKSTRKPWFIQFDWYSLNINYSIVKHSDQFLYHSRARISRGSYEKFISKHRCEAYIYSYLSNSSSPSNNHSLGNFPRSVGYCVANQVIVVLGKSTKNWINQPNMTKSAIVLQRIKHLLNAKTIIVVHFVCKLKVLAVL